MGRKTSIVWNHFTIPPLYPKKALCNYCQQLVCRGQANLGTTSLMNHLKRCNDFKASVLGIPRGVSDMLAAAISAADAQLRKMPHDDSMESCDFAAQNDIENVESEGNDQSMLLDAAWPCIIPGAPGKSLRNIQGIDDAPTLVSRMVTGSRSECRVDSSDLSQRPGDYQNDERSSVLLYGDISSTSDSNEEPSSSTFNEVSSGLANSSVVASDLVNYASSSSCVDFVYGGIMLHNLHQQYKSGKFCDMHIIPQKMSSNEVTISETGKVTRKNVSSSCKEDGVISVHSCVLGAVSRKVNSFVEMGCTTIHLKKGGRDSVRGLMEIVYTGKLNKVRTYSESQLLEILEVARFLEVDLAVQYLMREIPEGKHARPRSNVEKLIHERMQTLKTAPSYLTQSAAAIALQNMCTNFSDTSGNVVNKEGGSHERIAETIQRKRKAADSIPETINNHHHLGPDKNVPHLLKSAYIPNSLSMPSSTQNLSKRCRKYAVHEMSNEHEDISAKDNNEIPVYETHQPDTIIKSEAVSPICHSNHRESSEPLETEPLGELDKEE